MKNVNHYLKDGTKWVGSQHSTKGKVMTGKSHTTSSKPLYHFADLSASAKKQTLSKKK